MRTVPNTALGMSSPAYPALQCEAPISMTTALTSSASTPRSGTSTQRFDLPAKKVALDAGRLRTSAEHGSRHNELLEMRLYTTGATVIRSPRCLPALECRHGCHHCRVRRECELRR